MGSELNGKEMGWKEEKKINQIHVSHWSLNLPGNCKSLCRTQTESHSTQGVRDLGYLYMDIHQSLVEDYLGSEYSSALLF